MFYISHGFDAAFCSVQQPMLRFLWIVSEFVCLGKLKFSQFTGRITCRIFSEAHWEFCCWCFFLCLCLFCVVCLYKHQYIVTSLKAALSVLVALGLLYSTNILQASLYHGGMAVLLLFTTRVSHSLLNFLLEWDVKGIALTSVFMCPITNDDKKSKQEHFLAG